MAGSAVAFLWERFERARDETALIAGDDTTGYGRLLEAIGDFRRQLEGVGVGAGSVVLLKGDFSARSVAALLALFDLGAVVIPLAPTSLEKEAEFAETGEAEFILDTLAETALLRTGRTAGHSLYRQLRESSEAGLVIFSSGSTGKSKGAVHGARRLMTKFVTPRRNLRTLSFLLFDHIAGIDTLFYCLSNTSCIVIPPRRDPDTVCAAIARHRVEVLPTAPSFLNLMLLADAHERHDLSSLKIVTYGSEMMPQSTLERCAAALPHVQLVQRYGASELGSPRSQSRDNRSRWIRLGGEGVEWRVAEGKLEVKSPSAMLGYLNSPSPFTQDGFFVTGDRVEVDGDYVRFLGRDGDMINVGGQKVFPAEIEDLLLDLDLIAEASVYGEPNPLLGSAVVCKVRPVRPDIGAAELRGAIRRHLSGKVEPYKIPQKVVVTQDVLATDRFKQIRR